MTPKLSITKNAGSSIAEALEMDKSWHHTAQAYRQMLGRPAYYWRFSFAFVRNPWDRFLSLYRYPRLEEIRYHSATDPESSPYGKHEDYGLLQNASVEDCDHYLEEGRLKHDDFINHWRPQSDWVTDDDGEVILDFIGRMETIDEDFQTVARQIDLSIDSLPLINASDGTPHRLENTVQRSPILLGVSSPNTTMKTSNGGSIRFEPTFDTAAGCSRSRRVVLHGNGESGVLKGWVSKMGFEIGNRLKNSVSIEGN